MFGLGLDGARHGHSMKIATFNINNVVRRLPNLLEWLRSSEPDVVCLQELKTTDGSFPQAALADAGYGAVWRGQRSWNGVAILARGRKPILVRDELPGDAADRQSRYIEAAVGGVLVACIYLPNGNPQPGPKFDYKLAWFERLIAHAGELHAAGVPAVLAGDYNVVPTDLDIYPTKVLGERCAAAAGEPRGVPTPPRPGLDRRDPRAASVRPDVYVLALHAESLGARRRSAHRPSPAQPVAASAAWLTPGSIVMSEVRSTPVTTRRPGSCCNEQEAGLISTDGRLANSRPSLIWLRTDPGRHAVERLDGPCAARHA